MKQYLSLTAICITIVLSVFFLSRTRFVIKNDNRPDSDTISVSGDGKVFVKPDMVNFSFSFEETAPTSQAALDRVSQKVNQALALLDKHQIAKKDISTSNLSINTDYDYSYGTRKIKGQRASQSLEVKVKNLDDKATKAATLIDDLSTLDSIHLNGIYFDIEDKTKFYTDARQLAFDKAKQKATELARLSGLKLKKPVSITDAGYDYSPRLAQYNFKSLEAASSPDSDTSLSGGQLQLSVNLNILWGVE